MWDYMPDGKLKIEKEKLKATSIICFCSLLAYSCVVDELCMVAAGNLDAFYIEDMYPWDCAAGSLLVSEAGGVVTHPFGGPFDIMKPDLICAGTEELRKEIEDLLRKADKEKSVGGGDDA